MVGRYPLHRSPIGKGTDPMPIFTFKTQQCPYATAVGLYAIGSPWWSSRALTLTNLWVTVFDTVLRSSSTPLPVDTSSAATACRHFQCCVSEAVCTASSSIFIWLALRFSDGKGVIRDALIQYTRLFSELLLQRYKVPLPDPSESLLARS
ncbi:hypothetical protein EDB19DRAFT_2038450 [Suillus lakei]|nr:hypothetical protein EDB19DRAFT_2038450 [Suillus lakei]